MTPDTHGIGMTSSRTRERLIARLRSEGIKNEEVLEAMRNVPRHLFIDEALASRAYEDTALPIGYGQTISQPYIVALMTQTLFSGVRPQNVLEIGTGSGYQTAVLAALVKDVYSVERIEPLLKRARGVLARLGNRNVRLKLTDGSWGWVEHARYDGIVVTAAAPEIPEALKEQLAPGGRLVIPVGSQTMQELILIRREGEGFSEERLEFVNFVPLIKDQP